MCVCVCVCVCVCAYYWFVSSDPFSEPQKGGGASSEGHIHIRIQQRNGRKTLTTVQGIAEDFDKKKIVKVCKKVCHSVDS